MTATNYQQHHSKSNSIPMHNSCSNCITAVTTNPSNPMSEMNIQTPCVLEQTGALMLEHNGVPFFEAQIHLRTELQKWRFLHTCSPLNNGN
jgi:hypothetical protein